MWLGLADTLGIRSRFETRKTLLLITLTVLTKKSLCEEILVWKEFMI